MKTERGAMQGSTLSNCRGKSSPSLASLSIKASFSASSPFVAFPSKKRAMPVIVGCSKMIRNRDGFGVGKRFLMDFTKMGTSNEWPPNSKELSFFRTSWTPKTSRNSGQFLLRRRHFFRTGLGLRLGDAGLTMPGGQPCR